MPNYLKFTHKLLRKMYITGHPIPGLLQLINLYLDIMLPFKKSKCSGVNFLTLELN